MVYSHISTYKTFKRVTNVCKGLVMDLKIKHCCELLKASFAFYLRNKNVFKEINYNKILVFTCKNMYFGILHFTIGLPNLLGKIELN